MRSGSHRSRHSVSSSLTFRLTVTLSPRAAACGRKGGSLHVTHMSFGAVSCPFLPPSRTTPFRLSPDPPASSDVPTYQRFPPSRAERREARRRRGNGESSGNGQGNGAVRLIMVDLGLSLNVLSYLPA